jgi:hypothetical protein
MRFRLAALLLLLACRDGLAPGADLGAVRFAPPASYREMWARAETCSGRTGDFDRIRWWVVPGVSTFEYDEEVPYADGLWHSDGHITLAGAVLDHPMVVRHEMLHHLLRSDRHPAVPFRDPCRATWASWDTAEARLLIPPELAAYAP